MSAERQNTTVWRTGDSNHILAIEAIIFDMDGLLIDSEPLTDIAFSALMEAHDCHIDWTPELIARVQGRRMTEILEIVAGICGIRTPIAELSDTLEAHRLEVIRGNLQAKNGALECIAHMKSAGLPLALATSGRRSYVDAALGETGLAGAFAVEVTGESVTRGKPDPEVYLLAAHTLGIEPAYCVVFEDAPAGIAAAVAAGMTAVAVPDFYTRDLTFDPPPHAVLPDLHAAIAWLEERQTRPL